MSSNPVPVPVPTSEPVDVLKLQEDLKKAQGQVKELKADAVNAERRMARMNDEAAELERQRDAAHRAQEDARTERARVFADINKWKSRAEQLAGQLPKGDLADALKTIDNLRKQLGGEMKASAQLRKDIQVELMASHDAKQRADAAHRRMEAMQSTVNLMQAARDAAQAKRNEALSQKAQVQEELDIKSKALADAQKTIQQLVKENAELRKRPIVAVGQIVDVKA